ncbi:hypothetical protein CLV30_1177 [Haloactinopolyspora alba]|uniref:Uncharacterized protein n=1 Tax=Haloactinopolyspora alba TaxID=648780 RepID=A0A2P8DR96_9ACTN|nr:hypothetical protein [Haloactinopolyspora alba]PSK99704.1 hypothetical protein CLV30_1177 [Haloactinopolyspora alba]
MRDALRQRGSVRLEYTLVRLAAVAVLLAGMWFISWQLGHIVGAPSG